jgi:hypothetical protein
MQVVKKHKYFNHMDWNKLIETERKYARFYVVFYQASTHVPLYSRFFLTSHGKVIGYIVSAYVKLYCLLFLCTSRQIVRPYPDLDHGIAIGSPRRRLHRVGSRFLYVALLNF